MEPAATARSVPLKTPHFYTHWSGVKCVQANAYPRRASNIPCTSGHLSDHCRNQDPTQVPKGPRLTTNMRETIKEAQEAAPTLYQAIEPVVFHQDTPSFSPRVLPRREEWSALPARADTAHAVPALTETAASDPATPAAVRTCASMHWSL